MLLVMAACSNQRSADDVAPVNKVAAAPAAAAPAVAAVPAPAPVKQTQADSLVERARCGRPVASATWLGKWDGTRPFDDSNPFLHRGPTTIVVTAGRGSALHVSEGVGAAGYELDLELDADGVVARGDKQATETKHAIVVDGNMKPTGSKDLAISKYTAVAACVTSAGELAVWRVLDAHGDGIQAQHEKDTVLLQRRGA